MFCLSLVCSHDNSIYVSYTEQLSHGREGKYCTYTPNMFCLLISKYQISNIHFWHLFPLTNPKSFLFPLTLEALVSENPIYDTAWYRGGSMGWRLIPSSERQILENNLYLRPNIHFDLYYSVNLCNDMWSCNKFRIY